MNCKRTAYDFHDDLFIYFEDGSFCFLRDALIEEDDGVDLVIHTEHLGCSITFARAMVQSVEVRKITALV